jgi:hypothetical protein
MFGYGVIISDVCVSWTKADGSLYTKDCLQKIYPVGPSIVAGFAGSIDIGFALLKNLSQFLKLPEDEKDVSWIPEWVAENWKDKAKYVFSTFPLNLRKHGSEILMVGAHPDEDIGIPGFSRIYIVKMGSPNFAPTIVSSPQSILSIGSGSNIEEYKAAIENINKDGGWPLIKLEAGNPGGWATALSMSLSFILRDHPKAGISDHLHVGLIKRDSYKMAVNDRIENIGSENQREFQMPKVAKSYSEFIRIARNINRRSENATCSNYY